MYTMHTYIYFYIHIYILWDIINFVLPLIIYKYLQLIKMLLFSKQKLQSALQEEEKR